MTINNSGEYNSAQLDHEQISDLITELHNPCEWPDETGPDMDRINALKQDLVKIEAEIEDYDRRMDAQFDADVDATLGYELGFTDEQY